MTSPSAGRASRPSILLVQAVDYDPRTLVGFQPLCSPLSIATIAALTPDAFEVDLWDENLDGLIVESTVLSRTHYDIVGISTLFEQVGHRVPVLAGLFRARGTHVCAGGPGISNQLQMVSACVDSVFLNEAEYTWPQFLREWSAGKPQREYVQVAKPDLADSPLPKWGTLEARITAYRSAGVQTTRGCPFDCEFCDVIYLYGRAQRHKPIANVVAEVAHLQRLGARRVFFTDDEFIGDPRHAHALLQEIVKLNNSFPAPLAYHTQLTLNLSRHQDVMELAADANFWHVLIGIESFNEECLKETNKRQNCNRDIVRDCRKILSQGIAINGSLIVGFDHDGPEVFDNILEGCRQACIPFASVSILRPTHGTKLWARLRESKRLWRLRDADKLPQALQVDILTGGKLTRSELIEGRIYVNRELSRVSNLCERLNGWISLIEREPRVSDPRQLRFEEAVRMIRQHSALSLTAAERGLIEAVLEHTRDKYPVLMGRMVDSILAQLYWYRLRTFHTEDDLKAALAAEKAGDLVADTKPILVSNAFAEAFRRRLFAVVYERLSQSLPDPDLIPEAASEVFVDFLVRMRDDTAAQDERALVQPRQQELLHQLCDRTAARLAKQQPAIPDGAVAPGPVSLQKAKRSGLFDAVLKNVGDRLSRMNE